jgi:hypothetical protein
MERINAAEGYRTGTRYGVMQRHYISEPLKKMKAAERTRN